MVVVSVLVVWLADTPKTVLLPLTVVVILEEMALEETEAEASVLELMFVVDALVLLASLLVVEVSAAVVDVVETTAALIVVCETGEVEAEFEPAEVAVAELSAAVADAVCEVA